MTTSNPARIAVLGASGNGKSTVGRQLAVIHDVPYIELDDLHHGPNWTEASAEELTDRVVAALPRATVGSPTATTGARSATSSSSEPTWPSGSTRRCV